MHLSIHLCLVVSVPAMRAGCQVPIFSYFLACFLFSQPQFVALKELWTVVGLVAVKICPNNIWIHNLTCVESDDFPLKEVDLCNWMCLWWWKKFQTTDWRLISMLHENCWHTVMCARWCCFTWNTVVLWYLKSSSYNTAQFLLPSTPSTRRLTVDLIKQQQKEKRLRV